MPRKPVWDKHSIKAEINRRGQTLNSLGAAHGLNHGDISTALTRRYPKAEQVIAAFLKVPIWELWPDRYDEDGVPIRYIRKPEADKPISKAARNRLNQAARRRVAMQGAA